MPNDLRLRTEWSPDWWRDSHPLGLEGLASVGCAVSDLEAAERFYREVFCFEVVGRGEIKSEQAEAVVVRSADLNLELMRPKKSGTPLAEFLERKRAGFYSINWKVKSREKAAGYLKSKGLNLVEGAERATLDPSAIFGARYTFTDAARIIG
jgi:catechol 2,3-dioxygenase-like lactoylglutathione lyase family enzyme